MSNRPGSPQNPERRQLTRRQLEARQRESTAQRRVVFAIGGAIGLALALIIGGIVYERFYLPSRTLKQVNNQALTQGEYERLLRAGTIQQMAQALQFAKLFGGNQSFGQGGSFDQQIVEANTQLTEIGTSRGRQQPVNDTLVNQWVDRQMLEAGAQSQFNITPNEGEVDQLLVAQYGGVVASPAPLTSTDTLTGTNATTTAGESAAAGASATAQAATATPQPTPTLQPAEATTKAGEVADALYTELTNILGALPEEAPRQQKTPNVTRDELLQALRTGFRDQLVRQRVGEALVKEVPANDTSTPTQITARHILLQVPKETATPTPEAEATAQPAETATAEPTPAPTPSPEELERLFAERKTEADSIYQRLKDKPETFAELAKTLSEDPGSAAQGGEVGTFDREGQTTQGSSLVKPFVDAAWALKDNEISQPVRTEFGWHIIQRVPEDPKAKLERLRQEALDKWLTEQRATATIVPAPTPTATEPPAVTTESPAAEPATGTATP